MANPLDLLSFAKRAWDQTQQPLEAEQPDADPAVVQYLRIAGLLPEGQPVAPDVLPPPFPMHPEDIRSQRAIDRGLPQRPKMRPNEPRPYFDRRAR